jgi:hypothetical protein
VKDIGFRFNLWSLMIAIWAMAVLCALPSIGSALLVAIFFPVIALTAAPWQFSGDHRRLAGLCFGVMGIIANVIYIKCCSYPSMYVLTVLSLGLFLIIPSILAFGVVWGMMATVEGAIPRRSMRSTWPYVFVLAVLPLLTLWTLWPFHLFFLGAKPTMELLADRTAAGRALSHPKWAGPFKLLQSTFDPGTGDVKLMVDPNPNHPTSFLRVGPGRPPRRSSDVYDRDLHLGGRWWYQEED